jgi:putative salt-induced outer membrane protein YdiY
MLGFHRRSSPGAVVLAFLLAGGSARAQVNTENLRKTIKAGGISGTLNLSLDGHTGNTDGIAADVSGGVGFEKDRTLMFIYGSADYTRFNDAVSTNKNFAHLRYNYEFYHRIVGELFAQVSSDQFQDLKFRSLFGVGPRFTVVETKDKVFQVYLGVDYMNERDVYYIDATTFDGRRHEDYARLSSYLALAYQLDKRIAIASTSYYQPRLERWSDARILSEDGFIFTVTKHVAAAITFNLHFDSYPAPGVKDTDTELKNTLTFIF